MIARVLDKIEVEATDLEESTRLKKDGVKESLETYKLMDPNEKRKTIVDVSGEKTTLNEMIQRMKEAKIWFNKKMDNSILNYEQLINILDERQKDFNNAKIGTLGALALDTVNKNYITPNDYTGATVLEFARDARQSARNKIGGKKRRKTKKKRKRN